MLVAAGLVAAWQLPSSIYPPLEFPRIVIIAHSGTLPTRGMTLSVTRPLEQAAMSTPGHPPRPVAHVPRRVGSRRVLRRLDGHDRRAAAGAVAGRRDPPGAAAGHRAQRRAAHARDLPRPQPERHRRAVDTGPLRLRVLRDPASAGPGARRGTPGGVRERHARGGSRGRSGAARRIGSFGRRRGDRARLDERAGARGAVRGVRPPIPRARDGTVAIAGRHRRDADLAQGRLRGPRRRSWRRRDGRARSYLAHHRERPRRGRDQRVAAGRLQRARRQGRRPAGARRPGEDAAVRPARDEGLRPGRVRRRRDRQRPRRGAPRRAACHRRAVRVPARLAHHHRRRHDAARHGRRDVLLHEDLERVGEPDVDGRPRRRHRARHRRCGGGGGEHSPPDRVGCPDRCRRRHARADRTGGGLDAHDRCRVRAAGAAVGRDRSVLPIACADAVGGRAAVAGALVDAGAGAGGTGDGEPHARRGEPSDAPGDRAVHAESRRAARTTRAGARDRRHRGGNCVCDLSPAGARVPAGDGRRRLRHRLPDAGGHGTRRDRSARARRRGGPGEDARGRGVLAAHRRRARYVRHRVEQGRHPRAAAAAIETRA